MIYQVRANLFFSEETEALDFVDNCQDAMEKAVVVNPDTPAQEGCSVELIKCYHDQTPHIPCVSCGVIHCPEE